MKRVDQSIAKSPIAKSSIAKSRQKSCFRGCISGCVIFLVVLIVLILGGLILSFLRYDFWLRENRELLSSFSLDEESRSIARDDLDYNLERFQNMDIQKETIWMSCDQVGLLFEDIMEENWNDFGVENSGVVCSDRSLIVYVEARNDLWLTVKLWQRAEGSTEFVVYDVMVGPYSMSDLTFGYVSDEFSRGVEEAWNLVSSGDFSGRKVEEIYIEEEGVRIVGVLNDASE